jgi:hypothetical protein
LQCLFIIVSIAKILLYIFATNHRKRVFANRALIPTANGNPEENLLYTVIARDKVPKQSHYDILCGVILSTAMRFFATLRMTESEGL